MAEEPNVIAVIGGTGTIGQHLVRRLCMLLQSQGESHQQHIVRILSRDIEKGRQMFADLNLFSSTSSDGKPNLVVIEIFQGSVEDPHFGMFLQSATRLFLLTLTSLQHNQRLVENKILNIIKTSDCGANIQHIVRLSAHSRGMEGQPSNSPFRWHSECDEQLLQFRDEMTDDTEQNNKMAVTILRPSLFMQDMTRRHFAPMICEKNTFYQLGKKMNPSSTSADGNQNSNEYKDSYRIAMVDARDIGDVAACVLSEPIEKHAHNTYILSGPQALLWNDVALAISNVCGRTIKPSMLSDSEFYSKFGNSHVYLKQMQAYRAGCGEDVDNDIEIVTGRPPRSITQFCEDYAESWKT